MKFLSLILSGLVVAHSFRVGYSGVANFISPASSGSMIANFEGAINATTLICNVTRGENQIDTFWRIANFRGVAGRRSLLTLMSSQNIFVAEGLFLNELIVTNWTSEVDRVIVFCGTGGDPTQTNVTLRIYRPPILRDNFSVRILEGDLDVLIELRLEPAAFPVPSDFEWLIGGQPLIRRNGIITSYSSIIFGSLMRSDSGNYTVNATNYLLNNVTQPVGNDTGSFYLDVLYPPSFMTRGPTRQFVGMGDSVSLVCGTGLDYGNPQATITWTDPDGTRVNDSARFTLENGPTFVRLNFTNATIADNGVWRCALVALSKRHILNDGQFILQDETVIGSITQDIQLTAITPPGQPHTLSVKESEATLFQVCWEAPVQSDSHISYYLLGVCNLNSSSKSNKTIFSTITNATSSYVTGLLPGTTYELTVVAVSQGGDVVARSQPSDPIVNTTSVTVPKLSCNASILANGAVTVTWSYIHTGGLPLTNVSVSYCFGNNNSPIPIPLISVDTISVTIPDLKAGIEYTFNVTAVNSEGSSSTVCGLITPEIVPMDNRSTIAAIIGGVVGSLIVLGIIILVSMVFGITVAKKLRKQGNQMKLEAVYEDPDNLQQYTPKKDKDIELEKCPAYVEKRRDDIKQEECPAYGQLDNSVLK